VAAKGAKLAQPLVQTAAKRCLTEAGVNVAGEVTSELLDKVTAPEGAHQEQEGGAKPVLPGPARAALTGCLSGVLGVPVAKLGRTGTKATELATTAGVGYLDARLQGQSNKEALLAAGQSALTSAAIAHGHEGSERAKAAKKAASQEGGGAATRVAPHEPETAGKKPESLAAAHEPAKQKLADQPPSTPAPPHEKPPAQKVLEQQKANTGREGRQPTRAVPHAEPDLGPQTPSGLELDIGPQPRRDIPLNERDLAALPPGKGLEVYRGAKPIDKIPGVPKPQQRFGLASTEKSGTLSRSGTSYRELNAAEIVHGLRLDYDPIAGRPRSVSYQTDSASLSAGQVAERAFTKDVTVEGAQSTSAAYADSGYDRGHLAQREAFKGSAETELAVDQFTNVVPMKPELNRGAGSPWRAAEADTIKWTKQYGSVSVRVEPVYDRNPSRLRDGTPIPKAIRRTVTAPDGTILQDVSFLNR
jgi:DNA/RNA endonuclease G (NUC1)